MKARHDEHNLEETLAANTTRFLLELGKGFAFDGRQYYAWMKKRP